MFERRFLKEHTIDEERKRGIVEVIQDDLQAKEEVIFAYLHGSFVEGGSFRDIDVAIFMKDRGQEIDIESDLSLELTEKTGYPVEVRVINEASIAFQMAVLRKGRVLLSRSDEIRTDVIEHVGRRYREYVHFRNIVLEA